MSRYNLALRLLAATALTALTGTALADPPARVGRIAHVEGEVSFQAAPEGQWSDAVVNFPVTRGDAFWTGDQGRAEIQVGGLAARLDNESELDVVALRYGELRLALPQGSVNLAVRGTPTGGVTVSTPAGDVHIEGRGFYRVDVAAPSEDGSYPPAEVTVFQGQAEAPGPAGYTPVQAGQAAIMYAGFDPEMTPAQDTAIDDWSRQRLRIGRGQGYNPLPVGITGADDLAYYGDFVSTPEFGTVWFPRDTDPDWAPYREGRWAYVEPWGYTWIDDEPWGFAPFHYGRWAVVDGRWGWVPGQESAEPVYAPALVAFFGGETWNGGATGGPGAGDFGWVPLAPDEVYVPPYEVSDDYLRRANVANVRPTVFSSVVVNRSVVNVTVDHYRNVRGVTVVGADAFRGGVAVRRAMAPAPAEALARAPVMRSGVAARPPRSGLAVESGGPMGRSAPPPPTRLREVRAAVAAPTTPASKPPVILGARIGRPAPAAPGQAPAVMIAPAQIKHPGAQHREAAAPPPASPGASASPPPPPPPVGAAPIEPRSPRPAHPPMKPPVDQTGPSLSPAAGASPTTPEAQARRKARLEAARQAAASDGAPAQTAPATSATPPGPTPDAQAQADAKAKAAARRKARQDAAQKAAADAAMAPATQGPPH